MEETDDFGDLYADVGVDVNPASTVSDDRHSYGRKALEDDFVHGVSSHCNGDETGLNEESTLYGKIRGVDGFGDSITVEEVREPLYVENDDQNPSGESAECEEGNACCGGTVATDQTAPAEREDDGLTDGDVRNVRNQKSEEAEASSLSQYSDSEDDLHIVLNEDDGCYLQPTSMFRSSRPRGVASDDENEADDLVIVMGAETQDKNPKRVEEAQSPRGINDSGAERHRVTKNGGICGGSRQYHNSQYSQYKYVRQRAAGFANKHSAPPVQVGHGDTKISYCKRGSAVPSFCDFFLPRNKTIFDVGIDSLEKKPWRCPGVDITDFFNFGMDEESWKNYCMSLAQYREQVTMRLRNPVYESVTGSADSEAVRGEFSTLNKEERILSIMVATERNARWTEIPKGRAIQVEDSTGERLPSMDVRRPRVRDSDVVIQVILQEEVEASQGTHEENDGPRDGSVQNKSAGKKAYEMESKLLDCSHNCSHLNPASSVPECLEDTRLFSMPSVPACGRSQCSNFSSKRSGISHLERYSGEDSAHNDDRSDKQSESHTSGNNRKRDAPKDATKNHGRRGDVSSKSEHSPSQAESVFSDQTRDGSRDGHVERHSSYENGSFTDVEKITSSREQHYISAPDQHDERPTSSQDRHCIEYKNKSSKTESVRSRARLKLHQEGKTKRDSRTMRRSRERSKMPMEDGASFSRDNSKDEVTIRSEIMEGKVDFYSPYEKRNTVYYEEAEESNRHRRRLLEGCRRGNDYSEDIYDEKGLRSPDVGAERNIAIRHYPSRGNVVGRKKHGEAWLLSRGTKISRGRGLIPDEECDRSGVEHLSADNKKHRYEYLKYESEIRMGMGMNLNDVISRKSHKREVVREGNEDCMPYPDQGMEISGVKERYGHDMRSNMRKSLRGWEREEMTRMHLCKRDLYSPDRKHHGTVRSKIISENPNIEDAHYIHGEKERIREHYWQTDSRDLCYKKHQCEGLLSHGMAEHCHSSKLKSLKAANYWDDSREDSRFSPGSFFSENVRNGWLSKDVYDTDDESSSACWHQDNRHGLCSYYSHLDATFEHKDAKRHVLDGGNVLRFGRLLSNKGRLWESDVDLQINSFSDVGDEGKNYGSTPLSCRESVKSQRNVWEEKLFRRYPRMGNLRRVSSDEERRAFRKLDEFCPDNEVSFWNSRAKDKELSNVNSEIEKRLMHDTKNSCCRQESVSLDKHHREAEVTVPKEDPALEKYSKKKVIVEKKEEASKVDACADVDQNNFVDKVPNKRYHEKGTGDNQSVPEEDNKRILEMLAKMEKRRERFKESVSIKGESDRNLHHVFSVVTENQESERREGKQRPIRKRRWCGS